MNDMSFEQKQIFKFYIGYDDIFWVPQFVKTVSEIPDDIKNTVSHRAKALQSVLQQLQGNYS